VETNMAKDTCETFTKRWKKYVEENKTVAGIPEEDWRSFFAPSNPVAGIDFGQLLDRYKNENTNERETIKSNWVEISRRFREVYKLKEEIEIKKKLKEIKGFIQDVITKHNGRIRDLAINRILTTLYPDNLLTIPSEDHVVKFAELLGISTENKKWVDLCFEIKPILKIKYSNLTHWAAYLQLVQERNLTKNYNLILTGAPGTGKTYMARQMAANLIGIDIEKLSDSSQYGFVQFHPSYDYTDFIEGLRPIQQEKNIVFERVDGIFKAFCAKAAQDNPENKYVFVIDEINRGEISKIFGELFFSIDPGYRGETDDETKMSNRVGTQYQNMIIKDNLLTDNKDDNASDGNKDDNASDKKDAKPKYYPFKKGFYVPKNVFVIGTMNDIDRSVESMDFAFRRRFSFYEIKATDTQYSILKDCSLKTEAIIRMNNLNKAIEKIDGLSPAYHIGAAYFKKIKLYENEKGCWDSLWNNHIQGLLYEYLRGLPQKEINNKLKVLKDAYNKKEETIEETELLGS